MASQPQSLNSHHTAKNGQPEARRVGMTPHRVLDTILRVTTPENISFQHQIAGPFRRVIAYVLDILISIIGFIVLAIAINLICSWVLIPLAQAMGLGSLVEALMGMLAGLFLISYFIVYWFYGAIMETYYNGQTYGKRWTNLRVLSADGHSIDGVQATLRNFFRLLDIAPMVSLGTLMQLEEPSQAGIPIPTAMFGFLIMAFSKKYQRAGDLVAGTIVIHETTSHQPDLATFTDERVPSLAGLIPPDYVATPTMLKAIADYVDRRRFLPYQRSAEIAKHLSSPLLEKFGTVAGHRSRPVHLRPVLQDLC
jgi:uncharacterized RDD family membrane protein YckC